MKKSLLFLLLFAAAFVGCTAPSTPSTDGDVAAAEALAQRVMGAKAFHIVFHRDTVAYDSTGTAVDAFRLEQEGRRVAITANDAGTMAVGLNHYLKYYCNVEVGWFRFDTYRLPRRLPAVPEPVTVSARVPNRFFLNYCTFGYTMPWWGWDEWEHFIDWMAMNGINLPLAITGQESIWYRIWTELGLEPDEVRAYFTGPAHLPWHRMQNIDRWGGPLPESWLDGQLELQQRITSRERQLSMTPVLPAFAGHVPRELSRLFPDAPITQLGAWAGYPDDYACSFLDPMSDLYSRIQKMFIEKETEMYGTDHVYGIDLFNELTPPSWEPDYLGRVSRQVYESLVAADPDAIWLQMGWLFYNERRDWTNDRVEAYLTSFPADRQLLLDYYCEAQEVWRRTEQFFGVPYVWCYLGNFGGNTMLAGQLQEIDRRLEATFAEGGSNFSGIGSTLEGFDCNPYVYEYLFEKAWDAPLTHDVAGWIDALAARRTGTDSEVSRRAWHLLLDSVYVGRTTPGHSAQPLVRPSMGAASTYYCNTSYSYLNEQLCRTLGLMLDAEGHGAAYDFDLANLTRQLLSNHFRDVFNDYRAAVRTVPVDTAALDSLQGVLLGIFDDLDRVTATHPYFLMGRWIAEARAWGADEAEADYFEQNARNLLTTWSDRDQVLNDYAARAYNGLLGTYYRPRYELFFSAVRDALAADAILSDSRDDARYAAYLDTCTTYEKRWWHERLYTFPSTPQGDARTVVAELYEKYKDRI